MDDACLQGDNTQCESFCSLPLLMRSVNTAFAYQMTLLCRYLVDRFVETAEEYGQWTQGSHVMFLMGSDFHYSNARLWCVHALPAAALRSCLVL
jgi:hypothetical protein